MSHHRAKSKIDVDKLDLHQRTKSKIEVDKIDLSIKQESDSQWQEILVLLQGLDQQQMNQMCLPFKPPKQGIMAAFQALATLLGTQYQTWSQISKVIQQKFVLQLSNIKTLLKSEIIPQIQIIKARNYIDKCSNENLNIITVAKKIVSYCENFAKDSYQVPQKSQRSTNSDLKSIEQDIRVRKESLQRFLESAYEDDIRVCITPPKKIINKSAQSRTEVKPSYTQLLTLKTEKKKDNEKPKFDYWSIETKKQKNYSASPISIQKKNQEDDMNNISYMDIQNEIRKGQKEIKQLRATENKLKWEVERDTKKSIRNKEIEKQKKDLDWNREECQRKTRIERKNRESHNSYIKETNNFKQMLSSPKSNQACKNQRILTQEEEVIVEEIEKYKDQYKSLCSQLTSTLKQKVVLQKDVRIAQTVIKNTKRK